MRLVSAFIAATLAVAQTGPALIGPVIPPVYPSKEQQAGHEGIVKIRVEIGVDGAVKNASVSASTGYKKLDESALKAVRGYRFKPATNAQGEAIATTVEVPISFDSGIETPAKQLAYVQKFLSLDCGAYREKLQEVGRKEGLAPGETPDFRWNLMLFEELMKARGDLSRQDSIMPRSVETYEAFDKACAKDPQLAAFGALAKALRFKP